jgi:hypothetical protein
MRLRWVVFGGLCVSLLAVTMIGCSKKSNPAAPEMLDPSEVGQVVEQAGKLQPLGPDKDVITNTVTRDEGAFRYVTETHDAAKNIQEITYLGLNDDVIWTGNLIKGADLHRFIYEPVVGVARNPVTLSINLENSGSGTPLSLAVSDPKLSTVRQGISDLLSNALQSGMSYAARAQFEKSQVYSESQLNLMVGADLKYGAGSLNTRFDWASTTRKNKIIAKYQQLYYTIDMDTPSNPAAVFASSNTLEQVQAAIPPGSCPVYVAGVTYGMMALTFIETDYTETEMNASLDAAYGGLGLDVEVRTGLTKRQVLENSSIKTVVYGGASAGLDQIETGYQGFVEVVHASIQLGTSAPGVPLIYKFRHLKDNTLAAVTLTSQYSITRLIRLNQQVRIIADKFKCVWANDDCGDDQLEVVRLTVRANAVQRTSASDPGVSYCLTDTLVYDFSEGGYGHQMNDGDEHLCGTSVVFELDAEHYDYALTTVKLYALSLDAEPTIFCTDDPSYDAAITVPSTEFGSNPHVVTIYAPDYQMECQVRIEMANVPAKQYAVRRR